MKRSHVAIVLLILILAFSFSCKTFGGPKKHWYEFWKRAPQPAPATVYPVEAPRPEAPPPPPPEVAPLPLVEEAKVEPGQEPEPMRMEPRGEIVELQAVYFDFDKAELRPEAIEVLSKNLEWMVNHPEVHILIEGHCDERGTREYNYNLGLRRANTVKDYLVQNGANPEYLHTISYGEDRPVDPEHSEGAWAQNRRAQFLVY